jgi:hypothetical protein
MSDVRERRRRRSTGSAGSERLTDRALRRRSEPIQPLQPSVELVPTHEMRLTIDSQSTYGALNFVV